MKHLTSLAISVTVLLGLTLGPAGASPAGASSLVAKGKGSSVTVASNQTVTTTAKNGGQTITIKPTADIIEVKTGGYVNISKGKKSFSSKGSTYLCTKAGGCECAAGESFSPDPPPAPLGPGKITINVPGGVTVIIRGYTVEETCTKVDRCLLGRWNADLSLYLASLHLQVTGVSGTETYTFTKTAAYADASNYTINVIRDGDKGTFIVNGNASTKYWRTPQPAALKLLGIGGGWSIFVDAGPVHATVPASGVYAPFGPWAMQLGRTYQCKGDGATVQYTPDQASAPILLTRVSR